MKNKNRPDNSVHLSCTSEELHTCGQPKRTLTTARMRSAVLIYSVLLVLALDPAGRVTTAASDTSFIVHTSGSTRKGETLKLSCFLDGPPQTNVRSPTSYIWLKNGEPIPEETGLSLVLEDLTSQDEGDYGCGSPDVDLPQQMYHLDLFPSLPRPEIIQAEGAVGGRKSSLSCVVQDDDPMSGSVQYAWYRNSKQIEGQSGPVLQFDNVTEEDKGNYSCTAWKETLSHWSLESPVFRLIPLVAPEVFMKPATPDSTVKGMLEGNLTLTCEARAYPKVPASGYSWYHRPSYQHPLRPLGQNSSILKLITLTKNDSGIYICQARNDQNFPGLTPPGQASITVDVVYLQNIAMSPDRTVQEGNPLLLECSVDSHPKAYMTWNVNGLDVSHTIGNTDFYNVSQTSCSDTGTYICRAVNPEMPDKAITAAAQVHVHCTTEFPTKGPEFDVIQPDTAPFDFILPSEMPLVVLHPSSQVMVIVHPNCSFFVSPAFLPRFLHPYCDPVRQYFFFALVEVTESDEGNYSCVEGGKQRKQIPKCGKKLVLKTGQVSDGSWQKTQTWVGIAVTAMITTAVTGVLLVFTNRHEILRLKKELWKYWTNGCFNSESIRMRRTFESLYENSKVYVIPDLITPKQQSTVDGETATKATSHLLPPNAGNEDAHCLIAVLGLVMTTLQEIPSDNDLPCFLLHNTNIGKNEKIILILHKKLGVVLMSVKTLIAENCMHLIRKSANCLIKTKRAVRKTLQGLVKPEGVTAVLALPDTSRDDEANVKEHLGSTTDLEMLFGKDKHDFEQWAERLARRGDSQVWDLGTAGVNCSDKAFVMTICKYLTLAGGSHPGESLHLLPTIQSQLLSPAQMEVRDSPAKLLHMWGPPGEGKTALLIHRALRWLAEGKAVVVVAARDMVEATIMQHQEEYPKLRKCQTPEEMETALEELEMSFPDVEICVITGILHRPGMLQSLLDAVKSEQVSAALSMFTDDLPIIDHDLSAECKILGWEIVHFPQQKRPTEDKGSLLSLLKTGHSDQKPAHGSSYVSTRSKANWKFVDHCLHQNVSSNTSCDQCKEELTPPLPSSREDAQWNDWVVFHTGNPHLHSDLQPFCDRLQGLGVPAVLANKLGVGMENGQSNVSLLWVFDKLGLKKNGVLVVHYDDRDNQADCQSERDRHRRRVEHRKQWIQAVLSSTEQVVLLLLTPSPARSLLGLPDPGVQMQPSM